MTEVPRSLKASVQPLASAYDCAMLDLDGVVYVGPQAVAGVPEVLMQARARGMTLAFVTNNASRSPDAVAAHLRKLGVNAAAVDVVTSAQAAARIVAERVPTGAKVLVIGGEGLVVALTERGLTPVASNDERPVAVVQGFDASVGWSSLAEGAYAISEGAFWVASNLDPTIPTDRGVAPGNGTLVDVVATAVGRRPDAVAGKPFRPLFDETVRRIASTRPLVVGDRLDTDIEGAVTCGADSLLVMTGVTDLVALCRAPSPQRPDYVSWTMEGLMSAHNMPEYIDGAWTLGGWAAAVDHGLLELRGQGDDDNHGLRVLAVASWDWSDRHGGDGVDTGAVDRSFDGR